MRVRALHGWATATMVAVAVAALAGLLDAFAPLARVWAAERVDRVGGTDAHAIAVAVGLATTGAVLLTELAAGVCVLVWLFRASANVRVFAGFGGPVPRFRPSLAIVGWFVPLVNLFLPALVVADLARCAGWRRGPALVWLWWAVYLGASAAAVASLGADAAPELRELDTALAAGRTVDVGAAGHAVAVQITGRLPAAVLVLAAAVLLLILVDGITGRQYTRLAELYRRPAPVIPAQPVRDSTVTGPWGATIGP